MLTCVGVFFLILPLLYVWGLRGRRGISGVRDDKGFVFAHRGLHQGLTIPENSAAAFRLAAEKGYGSELDVHLLTDGGLAVFHDSGLERMTGGSGEIENLKTEDLRKYKLGQSEETIPTLKTVLDIYSGKAPLLIELKTNRNNYRTLCETVCRELDHYKGTYVMESFDPKAVLWLRRHRPDIVRGQLSTNFFKERSGLSFPLAFAGTYLLANFATKPDFIAYHFQDRKNLSNRLCLKLWKLRGASWTISSPDEYQQALKEGLWPIFENFEP